MESVIIAHYGIRKLQDCGPKGGGDGFSEEGPAYIPWEEVPLSEGETYRIISDERNAKGLVSQKLSSLWVDNEMRDRVLVQFRPWWGGSRHLESPSKSRYQCKGFSGT